MSTRTRFGLLVASMALILVLPLAGVAAAKTKDGCKALTADDVSAAFGEPVGEGTPSPPYKGFTSCTWAFPAGGQVFLGVDKVSKVAKKDFEERSKEPGAEKVPGLKKSFFTEAGSGETITFIDGKTFVNLQFFTTGTPDPDALKAALTELAKKAAKAL